MPFKAVLFDLDGTLLNSLRDLADSTNVVLSTRGLPVHPVEAYRHFVGDGVAMLIRRVLPPDETDDETVAACIAGMRAEYARRWSDHTRPYPGVPELLDHLSGLGVPMCVVSNKPDDFTHMNVDALLSRWHFEIVLGQRAGIPPKPDPAGALEAAAAMKIQPSDFLYLGDTATDMKTAVSAGMHPVGALWGFRDAPELASAGARHLIAKPPDLIPLLGM